MKSYLTAHRIYMRGIWTGAGVATGVALCLAGHPWWSAVPFLIAVIAEMSQFRWELRATDFWTHKERIDQ